MDIWALPVDILLDVVRSEHRFGVLERDEGSKVPCEGVSPGLFLDERVRLVFLHMGPGQLSGS